MDEGGVPISYSSSVHLHSRCYNSAVQSCNLSVFEVFLDYVEKSISRFATVFFLEYF